MKEKRNVYIVDDIQENLQVIGNVLKNNGLNISIARNGIQALKGIKKKIPDLILLDISMPEMDGYEVCKALKRNGETANIPIIFLTARIQTEDIIQGFKVGGVDYITKPFNPDELLARVFTHLELKESKDIIEEQNSNLKELNATKDKFFRIIGHDLKSVFNQLLGFSSLLYDSNADCSQEEVKEISLMLNKSAKNAFKLLENLLDWARSQSGALTFNPEEVNLSKIIEESISFLREIVNNKSINLNVEEKKEIVLKADKNMISTILRNLISNAIKFTNEGGEITVKSKLLNNEVEVSVIDTGVGISEEDISRLFRLDVHHVTLGTDNETGTGLGLILCKEFIEKHNGKIWVESDLGKGSKFSFILPLK